jgi:hypothetical protein
MQVAGARGKSRGDIMLGGPSSCFLRIMALDCEILVRNSQEHDLALRPSGRAAAGRLAVLDNKILLRCAFSAEFGLCSASLLEDFQVFVRSVFRRMTIANTSNSRGTLLYIQCCRVLPLRRATPHSERANRSETVIHCLQFLNTTVSWHVRSARVVLHL